MSSSVFPVPLSGIQESIIAAKGDLIVGTANDTPGILSVGTNGHILVADSSTATGLKYAAPSAGALTLINATTFSAVASQSINNVFSSTYENYKVIIKISTNAGNIQAQFRYRAAGSDLTSAYRSAYFQIGNGNTTQTLGGQTTYINLGLNRDINSPSGIDMTVYTPAVSSIRRPLSFVQWNPYGDPGSDGAAFGGGDHIGGGAAFDGFTLLAASGTISGTVRTYGLANS